MGLTSRWVLALLLAAGCDPNPCGSPNRCRGAAEAAVEGRHQVYSEDPRAAQTIDVDEQEAVLTYTDADGNVWRARYRR